MAKPKSAIPLEKVTLNLFEGDWNFLAMKYPQLGPSRVVRDLVRTHRRSIEGNTIEEDTIDVEIDLVKPAGT